MHASTLGSVHCMHLALFFELQNKELQLNGKADGKWYSFHIAPCLLHSCAVHRMLRNENLHCSNTFRYESPVQMLKVRPHNKYLFRGHAQFQHTTRDNAWCASCLSLLWSLSTPCRVVSQWSRWWLQPVCPRSRRPTDVFHCHFWCFISSTGNCSTVRIYR